MMLAFLPSLADVKTTEGKLVYRYSSHFIASVKATFHYAIQVADLVADLLASSVRDRPNSSSLERLRADLLARASERAGSLAG